METGKFVKVLVKSFIEFILFLSDQLQAQEKEYIIPATPPGQNESIDTVKTSTIESDWVPTTSVYFELGGNFFLFLKC